MTETQSSAQVGRVSVKLPPFWDRNPLLWFANIEAQFKISAITEDETQYYYVVAALSSEILSYISDIIMTPPAKDKYALLKERLISEFSDSEQKKIKAILSELTLGDDKPSHLLRKMKQLAGKAVTDDFLKTLWLQRLPTQVQAILSVSEDSLDKLGVMADKIHETTGAHIEEVHCTKTQTSELSELRAQISELSKQIERLSRNPERQRRDSSSYRHRSKTPKQHAQCWYHWKFGEAANHCKPPCNYKKQEN